MSRSCTMFFIVVLTAVGGVAAIVANASYGATSSYTISFDHSDGAFGPPGTFIDLGSTTVNPADIGTDCVAAVTLTNNESKWAGNNLWLVNGDEHLVTTDVESGSGTTTIALGHLSPVGELTARLEFGPGGATSLAGTFTVVCDDPPVPTDPPKVTTPTPPATAQPPAPAVPVVVTARTVG
jgi:hypothetical protein